MTPDQLVTALLVSKDVAVTSASARAFASSRSRPSSRRFPLTMDVQAFYDEAKNPPQSLLADYPWLDLPKGASLEGFLGSGDVPGPAGHHPRRADPADARQVPRRPSVRTG